MKATRRFEEKASTFVFFQQSESTIFFRGADAVLLHFSSGQIESSLVRIHFKKKKVALRFYLEQSVRLAGEPGEHTIECSVF